jgi:hypothetical protein
MEITVPLLKLDTSGLEGLADLAPEAALTEAVALLNRLAEDPGFEDAYVLPLLKEARGAEEWYVANRYEVGEGSYCLEVFVWPPGSKTEIHDHASWGAFRCVVGWVFEERYERLDDGSRLNHARLKKIWQLRWGTEEGVSTVLPYDGGIHRVGNPGEDTAISVHLYGPRTGEVDGRDYDPSRHYVCDRAPEER